MEIWRDINGYEGLYQVSDRGRVRSVDRVIEYSNGRIHFYKGKVLAGFTKSNGYMAVDLYKDGAKKKFHIHRLVAEHFIKNENPIERNEINHIDEDKSNNSANNLEWCTSSENKLHGTCIRRANKTRKSLQIAEKAVCQFDLDGNIIKIYDCIQDAVNETGISRKSIYNSCNNQVKPKEYIWKYIA